MKKNPSIITVGLSPAWDITCRGKNLNWGRHENIDEQTITPAGKALNVSKALAWMGQKSIAAGLWGRDDYQRMQKAVRSLWPSIRVKMTAVAGNTRQNITIIDAAKNKEMHLRSHSQLAHPAALQKLRADLQRLVHKNSICVFAGAIPADGLIGDVISTIKICHKAGVKIVLDTSGPALRKIIDTGHIWLVKPNVRELAELVGGPIEDRSTTLAHAGKRLLGKVEIILISRGEKGAIVVTKNDVWEGKCTSRKKALSTVGCGDYLLAGFLKGMTETKNAPSALETAIKTAAAKAWGLMQTERWPHLSKQIEVKLRQI
jgi:1-phosphofructokinase